MEKIDKTTGTLAEIYKGLTKEHRKEIKDLLEKNKAQKVATLSNNNK